MKKLFLLFAAATLFVGIQACKTKTDDAPVEETTEVTTEVAPDAAVVVTDSATVVVDSTATAK